MEALLKAKPALDWGIRKQIAIGAARGLLYLHEQCDPKITHRDGDGRMVGSHSDQFCSVVVLDRESETKSSQNIHPQELACLISDTIPEEDVAHCLMMLSMDKWHIEKTPKKEEEAKDDDEETEEERSRGENMGARKESTFTTKPFSKSLNI